MVTTTSSVGKMLAGGVAAAVVAVTTGVALWWSRGVNKERRETQRKLAMLMEEMHKGHMERLLEQVVGKHLWLSTPHPKGAYHGAEMSAGLGPRKPADWHPSMIYVSAYVSADAKYPRLELNSSLGARVYVKTIQGTLPDDARLPIAMRDQWVLTAATLAGAGDGDDGQEHVQLVLERSGHKIFIFHDPTKTTPLTLSSTASPAIKYSLDPVAPDSKWMTAMP
jgi:hypothetical protein